MKKNIILSILIICVFISLVGCFSLDGVKSIEFNQAPAEMYTTGTNKNDVLKNLSITVKFENTSTAPRVLKLSDGDVTVLGLDFTTTGKKTVVVKYEGVTVSADYYVVEKIIDTVEDLLNVGKTDSGYSDEIIGLESKVFAINKNQQITIENGVRLIGQTGTVIEGDDLEGTDNFYMILLKKGTIENIEIRSVYGPAGANEYVHGIQFSVLANSSASIINCYIHSLRSGIQGILPADRTLNIDGNVITSNRTGILIDSTDTYGNLNITNNSIVANKTLGILFGNTIYDTENLAIEARPENPTVLNTVVIRKNNIKDNWFGQFESRHGSFIVDISQNYFGGMPVIFTDKLAQETPHPQDGGSLIQRPVGEDSNRQAHIYVPTQAIYILARNKWAICGGHILVSYYTDPECTNLVNYNPQS